MIVKKGLKIIGRIDEKILVIETQSYPLRNLVKEYIKNGVTILWDARHIEKTKTLVDIARRFFPKDGKNFWDAVRENLLLAGYDIA